MREEIKLSDPMERVLFKMSEGNPGALNVMMQIIKEKGVESIIVFMCLDDMNVRGTQMWIGYKNYCGSDIKKFIKLSMERDEGMVNKINEEGYRGNHEWKAVCSGASFVGREKLLRKLNEPS